MIEETIKRTENQLYRFAVAIMGNIEDAQDIVQDTYVKLIEKQPRFTDEAHEIGWLMLVTKNLCKSRLRSFHRRNSVELTDIYTVDDSEQRELIELVQSLPVKYKIVIHLYYYEGYSTKEIAKITKQKESTVRQQMTRARELLKKYLTNSD
jgi:RNA polymerase sigma-70 factor (ECF subfamily)